MNDHLNWRYTTKKFDPSKIIADQEFNSLLDILRLAPSSFGLQPWKFVTVRDPLLRKQIKDCAWGQSQVTDASHLIVFCALTSIDETYIQKYIARIVQIRGVETDTLSAYERGMQEFIKSQSPKDMLQWMKRQAYIPLGMLLAECAYRKIDVCPMEGFDVQKVDDALGLKQEGATAVALCPVGYRASDDRYALVKKVRFEVKDLFIER